MKLTMRLGSLAAGMTLAFVGCSRSEVEGPEPAAKHESPVVRQGPEADPGPIVPSPVPSLPATPHTIPEDPKSETPK